MLELRKGIVSQLPVTPASSLALAQREGDENDSQLSWEGNEKNDEVGRVLPIGKCLKRRKREKR
jgi:hypothetical protein